MLRINTLLIPSLIKFFKSFMFKVFNHAVIVTGNHSGVNCVLLIFNQSVSNAISPGDVYDFSPKSLSMKVFNGLVITAFMRIEGNHL